MGGAAPVMAKGEVETATTMSGNLDVGDGSTAMDPLSMEFRTMGGDSGNISNRQ